MLDPKLFRQNFDETVQQLKSRGFEFDEQGFLTLEAERKSVQVRLEQLQAERKQLSKVFGQRKAQQESVDDLAQQLAQLDQEQQILNDRWPSIQAAIDAIYLSCPNLVHQSVPDGRSEDDNVVIRHWGDIRVFDFEVQDHVAIGQALGGLDMDASARLSGARFSVLKGQLARLQRALIQFMLDKHQGHGYEEVYVPFMVLPEILEGTGQLPKFEADLFKVEGETVRYLIPTAEVPVTNLLRDSIVNEEDLPIRYVCHTPCFRSEAGASGRDTRGLIRLHQFEKVELVQFVAPDQGLAALELLTSHAEAILQALELPYRVVALCAGDIGFSSAKTYDLEVWLPSQNTYREISSCSWFGDFQARRMQARFRQKNEKPQLLHTLNGSGLAISRTLVALLENYQEQSGRVKIPQVLRPYLGGLEYLEA
jgi:seryl-tRNA synthetase